MNWEARALLRSNERRVLHALQVKGKNIYSRSIQMADTWEDINLKDSLKDINTIKVAQAIAWADGWIIGDNADWHDPRGGKAAVYLRLAEAAIAAMEAKCD